MSKILLKGHVSNVEEEPKNIDMYKTIPLSVSAFHSGLVCSL